MYWLIRGLGDMYWMKRELGQVLDEEKIGAGIGRREDWDRY